MRRCASTAERIELVLWSIAELQGGKIRAVILHPANWEVAYDFDVSHFERYPHPKRLTMVEGDAAAQLLTPIVARRWDLYYDENAHRFDVWTWRRHV